MFDLTLKKDLIEMLGKSINFPDVEAIGSYFFKNYSTHKLENISPNLTISSLTAAKRLVSECETNNKMRELFSFVIELDGTILNGRTVNLQRLESLLYRLSRTGMYFDFNKRKITKFSEDKNMLLNWGALKDGKEYNILVASVDICGNSELVKKYKTPVMEKIYYKLWEYLRNKLSQYNGRIWSWAGDGGIIAFREEKSNSLAVSCCLDILFSLPVFNSSPLKPIDDDIQLRIGMDAGRIKFFNDTGRIISDVINYAAHLEKKGTNSNGYSISENIYKKLNLGMQNMFKSKNEFEGRIAYSLTCDFPNMLK